MLRVWKKCMLMFVGMQIVTTIKEDNVEIPQETKNKFGI